MSRLTDVMSLSARAKVLTNCLLEMETPLFPTALQRFVPLLNYLAGGAGIAIGGASLVRLIRQLIQERNAPKLEDAMVLVLRNFQDNPWLLDMHGHDPEQLLNAMRLEVNSLVPDCISRGEASEVKKMLKRKLIGENWGALPEEEVKGEEQWNQPEGPRKKIRLGRAKPPITARAPCTSYETPPQPPCARHTRSITPPRADDPDATDIINSPPFRFPADVPNIDPVEESPVAPFTPCTIRGRNVTRGGGAPRIYVAPYSSDDESSPTAPGPSTWLLTPPGGGRSTYEVPDSDEEMASQDAPVTPPPPGFVAPLGGYGIDWDDDDLSSPEASLTVSPTASHSMSTPELPNAPPSRAYVRNNETGTLHSVSNSRNVFAVAQGRAELVTDTDLSPIAEGDSISSDRVMGQQSMYRVPETEKFYPDIQGQRADKKAVTDEQSNILDTPAKNTHGLSTREVKTPYSSTPDIDPTIKTLQMELTELDEEFDAPINEAMQKELDSYVVQYEAGLEKLVLLPSGDDIPAKSIAQKVIEAARDSPPPEKKAVETIRTSSPLRSRTRQTNKPTNPQAPESQTPHSSTTTTTCRTPLANKSTNASVPVLETPTTRGASQDIQKFFRVDSDGGASDVLAPDIVPSPRKRDVVTEPASVDNEEENIRKIYDDDDDDYNALLAEALEEVHAAKADVPQSFSDPENPIKEHSPESSPGHVRSASAYASTSGSRSAPPSPVFAVSASNVNSMVPSCSLAEVSTSRTCVSPVVIASARPFCPSRHVSTIIAPLLVAVAPNDNDTDTDTEATITTTPHPSSSLEEAALSSSPIPTPTPTPITVKRSRPRKTRASSGSGSNSLTRKPASSKPAKAASKAKAKAKTNAKANTGVAKPSPKRLRNNSSRPKLKESSSCSSISIPPLPPKTPSRKSSAAQQSVAASSCTSTVRRSTRLGRFEASYKESCRR